VDRHGPASGFELADGGDQTAAPVPVLAALPGVSVEALPGPWVWYALAAVVAVHEMLFNTLNIVCQVL
jgi:hypothetical protein